MLNEVQKAIASAVAEHWWHEYSGTLLAMLRDATPMLRITSIGDANEAYQLSLTTLQEAIEGVKYLGDKVAEDMKKECADVLEK